MSDFGIRSSGGSEAVIPKQPPAVPPRPPGWKSSKPPLPEGIELTNMSKTTSSPAIVKPSTDRADATSTNEEVSKEKEAIKQTVLDKASPTSLLSKVGNFLKKEGILGGAKLLVLGLVALTFGAAAAIGKLATVLGAFGGLIGGTLLAIKYGVDPRLVAPAAAIIGAAGGVLLDVAASTITKLAVKEMAKLVGEEFKSTFWTQTIFEVGKPIEAKPATA